MAYTKQTNKAIRTARHLIQEVRDYRGAYRVRGLKRLARRAARRAMALEDVT